MSCLRALLMRLRSRGVQRQATADRAAGHKWSAGGLDTRSCASCAVDPIASRGVEPRSLAYEASVLPFDLLAANLK